MPETSRNIRPIVTPEGIALPFEIAPILDRAGALAIDLVLIHLAVLGVFILGFLVAGVGLGARGLALAMLASFVIRNFYFSYFEIRNGGVTPGKSRLNLRVVMRSGGPLLAESVLARNLTREFEIFLPLTVLSSPESVLPALPMGAAFLGLVWLLVGALVPLFNRDHLRLGDLLGGTIVVLVPREVLLADPAAESSSARRAAPEPRYAFTKEHLDQYGIQELQVLEGLLRRRTEPQEEEVRVAVMRRIVDKIGWEDAVAAADATEFLSAYYRQLRARLEHKVLFGERQLKKRPGKLSRRRPQGPSHDPPGR